MGCSLKRKKIISVNKAFQEILDESGHKPNKIWVVKGNEFYSRSIKSWLQDNDIDMYSTHNEGKSVVAERSIKTVKKKISKYLTSVSKCVYIYKLS